VSKAWLQEHFSDHYVKKAQSEGYVSRAAYKLLAIQQKDQLIRPGMTVVDLGAAPGGWSQVASKLVGKKGQVIALDILPMEPVAGVEFIQGDFREQSVLEALLQVIGDRQVDVVISDMAPNLSGNKTIDQPRSMYLVELALECAAKLLKPHGSFLAKVFHGSGSEDYIKTVKQHFSLVKSRKPDASRDRSREFYLLAKDFQSNKKDIQ
jgi:23S rRNA (uridine2552-2'-O)-methyltransferase